MKGMLARPLVVVALVVVAIAAMSACGDSDTVVFATDGSYHPFNFVNEAGEIDGLERELGDELCRRAQLNCEWVINDWDAMIPDLIAEDFDAIIAGMSITSERDEQIDFTRPYLPAEPVRVPRAGSRR